VVFGVWKRDLDCVLGLKERELGGLLIVVVISYFYRIDDIIMQSMKTKGENSR